MINDNNEIKAKALYKYLKKNSCLQQYVNNRVSFLEHCNDFSKVQRYKTSGNVLELIKSSGCSINGSFVWHSTKEGDKFWRNLDRDFPYFFIYLVKVF